uniref:Uncharacterized protein n=1 Tax=Aegilops tauschii subsp. strangulata TaxID=200361 RepID=A0A453N906_AEGTS
MSLKPWNLHLRHAGTRVITSTEGKPDPLLPITSSPENSSWDRWFQRVRSSRSNKWW